jgi:hypothetical protein
MKDSRKPLTKRISINHLAASSRVLYVMPGLISLPRTRSGGIQSGFWIPAFAGMTTDATSWRQPVVI